VAEISRKHQPLSDANLHATEQLLIFFGQVELPAGG
jgi:hypothetical protein